MQIIFWCGFFGFFSLTQPKFTYSDKYSLHICVRVTVLMSSMLPIDPLTPFPKLGRIAAKQL